MTKKPLGRPVMPSGEKQSKRLQVLVTPDELKTIKTQAEAQNQSISAFLRDVIVKAIIKK